MPRSGKNLTCCYRKNGAPPHFPLYTVNYYYETKDFEFCKFDIEVINLGLEFFTGLLPYIWVYFHVKQTLLYIEGLTKYEGWYLPYKT